MNSKDLRLVKTDEIEDFEKLYQESPYISDPLENKEDREYYVLEDSDDNRIAFGYIRSILKKVGVIGSLYVKEEFRGEGYGSFLVQKLEEKLRDEGKWLVTIGVHDKNETGLRFWEENNYSAIIESVNEPIVKNPIDIGLFEKISPVPVPDNQVTIMGKWLKNSDFSE